MKIEYHHLRKFPFYEDSREKGLIVLFEEYVFLPVTNENVNFVLESQMKPALRPISDLTPRFISNLEIEQQLKRELESFRENETSYANLSQNAKLVLHQNLFDVDDLLAQNLAIDYKFKSSSRIQQHALSPRESTERQTESGQEQHSG